MDYISKFPSIVSFCEKCKIQDQKLIHKGLGWSQKHTLSLPRQSYVRKFNYLHFSDNARFNVSLEY
jgi:hypothetical protein